MERQSYHTDLTDSDYVSLQPITPLVKVATKVRLRRSNSNTTKTKVHGSEISSLGVSSSKVAEHLTCELGYESILCEKIHDMTSDEKIPEFEMEVEKLRTQATHLQSQLNVLDLSLSESRNHADQLSSLCAQYEANQTALLLVGQQDKKIEQAMNLLIEFVLGKYSEFLLNYSSSQEKHPPKNPSKGFDKQFCDQNYELLSNVFGLNSESFLEPADVFGTNMMVKLKCLIEHQREERETIRQTVSYDVEKILSPTNNFNNFQQNASSSDSGIDSNSVESQRLNLENAVLIQELSSLKEQNAELKARLYLLEKEKVKLSLNLKSKEIETEALNMQLSQASFLLKSTTDASVANSNNDPSKLQPLYKMQEMIQVFQQMTNTAELREEQSSEMIVDLKRANKAILVAYERSKRKGTNRIRKLEHDVKILKTNHIASASLYRYEEPSMDESQHEQMI